VGGLNAATADPKGIFIFRNEPAEVANVVMGRNDLQGAQRLVYILDLTQPNGMFQARDFVIRDGDTLFVTEAPFTQWNKVIAALTGSAASVNSLSSVTGQ
jgi:polysaccharide export outer membrane protein